MADIRQALADNISRNITSLTVYPSLRAAPALPCAQITRGPIEYQVAFNDGLHRPDFIVTVYVPLQNDVLAQQNLDAYMEVDGADSIKAAIESDCTLGGLVQDLDVVSATGEQPYTTAAGAQVLGTDWTVQVWL